MPEQSSDFLDIIDESFDDQAALIKYIDYLYQNEQASGQFNIIGAVNNLAGGKDEFLGFVQSSFSILNSSGDLHLLHSTVDEEPVYSYVYLDDHVPLFITNANKTDQIPPTISKFLIETPHLGRLMLSKRELDELRKDIVANHENILVPYFSARRSADSKISARRRPETERSIQYRAIDGLDTYREMRYNYGILPQIMVFEKPNEFKFKIKTDGTFVHVNGSLQELWLQFNKEVERVKEMKKYANTGHYGKADSAFFGEDKFSVSTPWAVEVADGISAENLENFESHMDTDFWEFSVSEYTAYPEFKSFQAELIDETTNERTTLKSKGNQVRVFPRELTDIDQSLRIFNFLSDHFDSECTPKKVA
ncbi:MULTISPECIES: hypothetical protein [Haloferax]|uniref:Uncharacterized protein n=2 Tax=Haloferax TaxID=2251 RepID=A0A6G1Z693_9EURY|nr:MULTISPECIES: hypothetical protein [Haloferax]KAB1185675.1 hypothetical protein Hfx1149_14660 [Haloferax sp. CBA1149]KAB1185827.1 hypothetical protein Hfx1149_14505 [Haloferax sp. CBA1149]KAB1186894.1 hypothetical protein Hfx1149_02165 [Haloferax sp. CBA1149]KAB1187795.1 hypothetical protein Hfx1149_07010 [Haloferax sp. CBA1149]MRW79524.1 hypothetical protein [Haloferax marinisediminis]